MFYVYILKCKDGSTYTGCTHDLKERFQRHSNGQVPATKPFLPVELTFIVLSKTSTRPLNLRSILNQVRVGHL